MIDIPGQVPIYLIVDALDECSNTTGTPSARDKVLNFVRVLLQSDHSNLFVCITSRPEQDISATLNPLTSPLSRVSLHEEGGQRQDIDSYVRSFVQTDASMRRWRAEDKELVISVLSQRAAGMWGPHPLFFRMAIDCIGQVSVGVLPVGHASSVHAIEYSESSGRVANYSG